jgi:hypothetical protein
MIKKGQLTLIIRHCEEQSDVAIRIYSARGKENGFPRPVFGLVVGMTRFSVVAATTDHPLSLRAALRRGNPFFILIATPQKMW